MLIFMDYSMPEMNGLETSLKIIDLYKFYKTEKPIICCLTAYSEQTFRDNAMKAGMEHFI